MDYHLLDKKIGLDRTINISFHISLRWLLVLALIPYALWEIYWALHAGLQFIKWHTHLMLYVYLWVAGYLLLYYLIRTRNRKTYLKSMLIFTSVTFSLLFVELVLCIFKTNETSLERLGAGYVSWYSAAGQSLYHTYPPNQSHWITKREYSYIRTSNSMGFSDLEWPVQKKVNEKRVLAMGDSFTEGDGAPYDSSYVAQLRDKLIAGDSTVYVMNGGTCGSDPFFNFVNYRDKLHIYQPDVIVQTLAAGDIAVEIILRGGMERFNSREKLQYKKAPWWEPIYALSYVSRLLFSTLGYNQLLLRESEIAEQKTELDSLVIDLFRQYAALAQKNNCKLILVLHPYVNELNSQKYEYDFTAITNGLKKIDNIQIYDLLPYYISYIKNSNKPGSYYYWKHDGHHNSGGYAMMAEGIYTAVVKELKYKSN